jgi:hypothetical protein
LLKIEHEYHKATDADHHVIITICYYPCNLTAIGFESQNRSNSDCSSYAIKGKIAPLLFVFKIPVCIVRSMLEQSLYTFGPWALYCPQVLWYLNARNITLFSGVRSLYNLMRAVTLVVAMIELLRVQINPVMVGSALPRKLRVTTNTFMLRSRGVLFNGEICYLTEIWNLTFVIWKLIYCSKR